MLIKIYEHAGINFEEGINMADTTVSNINEIKSNLITKTSSAILDIRRILNEPAAKRALPTALALIVTFVGIIYLFLLESLQKLHCSLHYLKQINQK